MPECLRKRTIVKPEVFAGRFTGCVPKTESWLVLLWHEWDSATMSSLADEWKSVVFSLFLSSCGSVELNIRCIIVDQGDGTSLAD